MDVGGIFTILSVLTILFGMNPISASVKSINSIGFKSKSESYNSLTFDLYVNDVSIFSSNTVEGIDTSSYKWIDFSANSGDEIFVNFSSNSADTLANLIFAVTNGPQGQRAEIYDSTAATIYPPNNCEVESSGCVFTLQNLYGNSSWDSSYISVYIAGISVLDYSGTDPVSFTAKKGEEIKIIETVSESTTLPAGYYFNLGSEYYYEKNFSALPSSTFIPNPVRDANLSIVGGTSVFASGSFITFNLDSTTADLYPVRLWCLNEHSDQQSFFSNDGSKDFIISNTIWGKDCWFSIESPVYSDILFVTITAPVTISLAQPLLPTYFNQGFNITLASIATSLVDLVRVKQECDLEVIYYDSSTVGNELTVTPKHDYLGVCKFSSEASGVFQASEADLEVTISKGTVSFSDRENIPTYIEAGQYITLNLDAQPEDVIFNTELVCSQSLSTAFTILSGAGLTNNFQIPDNFYGDDCVLNVTGPFEYYDYGSSSQNVTLTVAQNLTFDPISPILIRPEKLVIFPKTVGNTDISADLSMKLQCSGHEVIYTVITNENNEFVPDMQSSGTCQLSLVQSPTYIEASSFSQQISIKTALSMKTSSDANNFRSDFKILIETVGDVIPGQKSVRLDLLCGAVVKTSWAAVPLNEEKSLSVGFGVNLGIDNCILRAAEGSEFYVSASIAVRTVPNQKVPHPIKAIIGEYECKNCATKFHIGKFENDK